MLPISKTHMPSEMVVPTPDGGVEHTAAQFAAPQTFLDAARKGSMIIFPPQVYLMSLVARFVQIKTGSALEENALLYNKQRKKLRAFLNRVPAADTPRGKEHGTAAIKWADKVISPHHIAFREDDGRVVLGLEKPGPELEGTQRGGDFDRVVLVKFEKGGPRNVEIRTREEVLEEERKARGKL